VVTSFALRVIVGSAIGYMFTLFAKTSTSFSVLLTTAYLFGVLAVYIIERIKLDKLLKIFDHFKVYNIDDLILDKAFQKHVI